MPERYKAAFRATIEAPEAVSRHPWCACYDPPRKQFSVDPRMQPTDHTHSRALDTADDQSGRHAGQPAAGGYEQQQNQQGPQPAAWHNYSSAFTAAKAGMSGVDQEKVKQVVYEMSKNSAHFANEQRKQAQTDARIARLQAQAAELTPAQLAAFQKTCDAKISLLEAGRQLSKVCLVVDMDAFYASVEERDQPHLKDKPMAVGGMGMICTANYVARKFGVRSAMPGFIAKKLCPQLVFVKPDFNKYSAASAQAFGVFRSYDQHAQGASLDEAYLDVTDYCNTHGVTGEQVATELRGKVIDATSGLTCSVGVAPNMVLAKIASDKNKPNGQFVVGASRDDVMAFIADLPIRKLPGIGKVTEQVLQALGVSVCSDLIQHAALITALLSDISSGSLLQAGLGLGPTGHSSRGGGPDSSEPGRKGISCERTFSAMSTAAEMQQMVESLVSHLVADMASESIEAKTLTLKLKTTTFEVRTRAVTLPSYVSSASAMLPSLLKLLSAELPVSIRLMGVRASNLRKAPQTLDQLAATGRKLNALEKLVLQGRQCQQPQQQQQQQQQPQGAAQGQEGYEAVGGAEAVVEGVEEQQQQGGHKQQGGMAGTREQQHMWEEVDHLGQEGLQHGGWQPVERGDGGEEEEEGVDREGVDLWGPQQLPTQEQLQAAYEQQCRQQQQQGQCWEVQDMQDADSVNAAAAAAARPAYGVSCSETMLPRLHHSLQQELDGSSRQGQPASHLEQQGQQLLQQQGEGGVGVHPNKRQRRSFTHPPPQPPHTLAAAVPVAHHAQQQQQQQCGAANTDPGPAAAGGRGVEQPCWHKASDYNQQQQQHVTQQQWQHPAQQQQALNAGTSHPQAACAAPPVLAHDATATAGAAAGHAKDSRGEPAGSSSTRRTRAGSSSTRRTRAGSSSSSGGGGAGGTWTCLACTFSDNQQLWLRCSVCETPKGDTQPPAYTSLGHTGRGCKGAGTAAAAAAGGGSAAVAAGRKRQGGHGSKQLTLEHMGLQKQSGGK